MSVHEGIRRMDLGSVPATSPIKAFDRYYRSVPRPAGPDDVPPYGSFDIVAVPRPCVSWLVVIEVGGTPPNRTYRYRLVGSSYDDLVGRPTKGLDPRESYGPDMGRPIASCLDITIDERRPGLWEVPLPGRTYSDVRCHRAAFPFASDNGDIDHVIGLLVPLPSGKARSRSQVG